MRVTWSVLLGEMRARATEVGCSECAAALVLVGRHAGVGGAAGQTCVQVGEGRGAGTKRGTGEAWLRIGPLDCVASLSLADDRRESIAVMLDIRGDIEVE